MTSGVSGERWEQEQEGLGSEDKLKLGEENLYIRPRVTDPYAEGTS